MKNIDITDSRLYFTHDLPKFFSEKVQEYDRSSIEIDSDLIRKYRGGNKSAGDRLINNTVGIVVCIANQYVKRADFYDLVGEGTMGLMHALRKYKPDKIKFVSYAAPWIDVYCSRFAHRYGRVVGGRIAHNGRVHITGNPDDVCLDSKIGGDDNTELKLSDIIPNNDPHPDQAILSDEIKLVIEQIISELSDKERDIIKRRALIDKPESLTEIGKTYGKSREAVRLWEQAAMSKLRKRLHATLKIDAFSEVEDFV